MPQDCLALATLTGSRICHDLASPLGAVANGLELLDLSGVPDSPELSLIRDSISGARATLAFLRLAFGRAGAQEHLSTEDVRDIVGGYYRGKTRLTLEWSAHGSLSRARAQILILALLSAEQALPRGGRLIVRQDGLIWEITAKAEILSPDMTLWDAVRGRTPLPEIDPRSINFIALKECLDRQCSSISITRDATSLRLSL